MVIYIRQRKLVCPRTIEDIVGKPTTQGDDDNEFIITGGTDTDIEKLLDEEYRVEKMT